VAPERVALGATRLGQGDATVVGAALRAGWLRQTALFFDAVNTRWQSWVIGYGPELQRALLERLGFEDLRRAQRQAVLLALAVTVTVGLLFALSGYLAWRQRRHAPRDRAATYFASFARQLARLDVPPRAPSEGPTAYAERAARALPQAAARIRAIADVYLRARYEPDDGTALAELKTLVTAFRGA
jgi:hypothetical protein